MLSNSETRHSLQPRSRLGLVLPLLELPERSHSQDGNCSALRDNTLLVLLQTPPNSLLQRVAKQGCGTKQDAGLLSEIKVLHEQNALGFDPT